MRVRLRSLSRHERRLGGSDSDRLAYPKFLQQHLLMRARKHVSTSRLLGHAQINRTWHVHTQGDKNSCSRACMQAHARLQGRANSNIFLKRKDIQAYSALVQPENIHYKLHWLIFPCSYSITHRHVARSILLLAAHSQEFCKLSCYSSRLMDFTIPNDVNF